jgi:mRNA-degrading endonuclease RelE of RelBE toxin-antitoxin system
MNKKKAEKKLKALAKKMQSTYLEYLDSLEEEGNKIGKEEGYINIAIYRDSISIHSTPHNEELKKENQINLFLLDK